MTGNRLYLVVQDDRYRSGFLVNRAFALKLLEMNYPDPVAALVRLDREGGLRIFGADIQVSEEIGNE